MKGVAYAILVLGNGDQGIFSDEAEIPRSPDRAAFIFDPEAAVAVYIERVPGFLVGVYLGGIRLLNPLRQVP